MPDARPDPTQPSEPADAEIAADDVGASALAERLGKQAQTEDEEND